MVVQENNIHSTDMISVHDIEAGFIYMISEDGYPIIRKLLFKRQKDDISFKKKNTEGFILDEGMDLCETLENQSLVYPIVEGTLSHPLFQELGIHDGDLIISATSKVGGLLVDLGFPEQVSYDDLKYVKATLLDGKAPLIPDGIEIDEERFIKRNSKEHNSGGILRFYKYDDIPYTITDYEKQILQKNGKKMIYR